jgi:hypothetical protein
VTLGLPIALIATGSRVAIAPRAAAGLVVPSSPAANIWNILDATKAFLCYGAVVALVRAGIATAARHSGRPLGQPLAPGIRWRLMRAGADNALVLLRFVASAIDGKRLTVARRQPPLSARWA